MSQWHKLVIGTKMLCSVRFALLCSTSYKVWYLRILYAYVKYQLHINMQKVFWVHDFKSKASKARSSKVTKYMKQ